MSKTTSTSPLDRLDTRRGPAPQEAATYEAIEFIKKGQVTIPKRIRDSCHIEPGQKGTLIEVAGAILILPHPSPLPGLLDEVRDGLGTADVSLEQMVSELRQIRESSDYDAHA